MSNAIIPNFIVKKISSKVGFMIMFRDGTGNVYILKEISKELHNDPVANLPKLGISPKYKASIDKDGFYVTESLNTINSENEDILSEKITKMINSRELTFLNEGFLSPEILLGIELHNVVKENKGRDQDLPPLTLDQMRLQASRHLTDKMLKEHETFCADNGYLIDRKQVRNNLSSKFGSLPKLPESTQNKGIKNVPTT